VVVKDGSGLRATPRVFLAGWACRCARLRELDPETPILLVEHCVLSTENTRNQLLREQFAALQGEGVENLHSMPNNGMLAGREEGTVDRIHPTDLGFVRLADYYEPTLKELLGEQ